MRFLYKSYLILFGCLACYAQIMAQVTVGTGTNESQAYPFEPYYSYTYAQNIYLASEINTAGSITSLSYYFSGTSTLPNSQDLVIYLGHSSKTSFTNSSDWESINNLTQVYAGGMNVSGGVGWVTLTLNAPFVYNGIDNLIVAFEENSNGYDSVGDDFYCTNMGTTRGIHYRSDSTNPNPSSPPTATLTTSFVANTIFQIESCDPPTATASYDCTTDEITLNVSDIGDGTYSASIDGMGTSVPVNSTGSYPPFGTFAPDQTYNVIFSDGAGCTSQVSYVYGACRTLGNNCTSVISNGDFETTNSWVRSAVDGNNINVMANDIIRNESPLAGMNAAGFGGYGGTNVSTGGPYTSTLSRSVFLASGSTFNLYFWMLADVCSSGDIFTVTVDGNVEYTLTGTSSLCGENKWREITIDLSAYADNTSHSLVFELVENGTTPTRIYIDELLLENCTPVVCPANYNGIAGTAPDQTDYETDGNILSIQTIAAGTTIDYDAGTDITLGIAGSAGFEVQLGATFCAFIDGCNGMGGVLNPLGETEDNTSALKVDENKATILVNKEKKKE